MHLGVRRPSVVNRRFAFMPDSLGFALFVLAVLLVLGWFAVGTQYNVRRGNRALAWLQQGLPLVGAKTTLRWLGSSVVELRLAQAKDPFRTFEVMVVLEPRDIPIFWALGHWEGRRDLIILRAQLVRAPKFDLEARGMKTWNAAGATHDPTHASFGASKWTTLDGQVNGLRADYRGEVSPDVVKQLLGSAEFAGITLTRLTVSRRVPNLELHFLFPSFERVSAARVFANLRDLSETALNL